MGIRVISFTKNGILCSKKLVNALESEDIIVYTKCSLVTDTELLQGIQQVETGIGEWAKEQMNRKHVLLFIGACGIAVRAIAPCLVNKLCDSPVLVMDEFGQYIIPVLSGHVGGANEIALRIADVIGATPVITTATDLNGKFAVDIFAKQHDLWIANKEGIAKVSSKVLAGKEITVWIEEGHSAGSDKAPTGIKLVEGRSNVDIAIACDKPENDVALWLRPKEYVIGMGCRRGKEEEKIDKLIETILKENDILKEQIYAFASIDKKRDEEGFQAWCQKSGISFMTFTTQELLEQKGDFSVSEFVKEQVGVDNVCERAALAAAGNAGRLIYKKYAEDGMTIAIAKREWSVSWNEK